MKKIIRIAILIIILCIFSFINLSLLDSYAFSIVDGDLIRNSNASGESRFDIYIVKLINNKKFKRLILSPKVFLSYGHLDPSNVIEIDQATMDSYLTSDLVRAEGDSNVYRLYPQGDTGEKRWIKSAEIFNNFGYDWDSIYTINQVDRDEYITGALLESIDDAGVCKYRKGEYEMRIYDAEGRVTGLINGEVKQDIPMSVYGAGKIAILMPNSYYEYEIYAIKGGNYQFERDSMKDGNLTTFNAVNIPISTGETHRYVVDWQALANGENIISLKIDSNSDGDFEDTIEGINDELTCEEFFEANKTLPDDSLRWIHVNTILSSISQYIVDNSRTLPLCAGSPDFAIPTEKTCLGTKDGCCNLASSLTPAYLISIPIDRDYAESPEKTGYTILREERSDFDVFCIEAEIHEQIDIVKMCR